MKLRLLIITFLWNFTSLVAQETPSYANFIIRSTNLIIKHWSEFKYYTVQQRQMDNETVVFEIKQSFSPDSKQIYFNDHYLKVKAFIPKVSNIDSISVIQPELNFPYDEFNTAIRQSISKSEFKEYHVGLYFDNIFKSMGKYYTKIGIVYPGPRSVAMLYIRFDSSLNIEEYVIHGVIE